MAGRFSADRCGRFSSNVSVALRTGRSGAETVDRPTGAGVEEDVADPGAVGEPVPQVAGEAAAAGVRGAAPGAPHRHGGAVADRADDAVVGARAGPLVERPPAVRVDDALGEP